MKRSYSVLLLLILVTGTRAPTYAAELFIPVSVSDTSRAIEYNARFVSEHVYFAKRHRVIRINSQAILHSPVIVATMFPGTDSRVSLTTKHMNIFDATETGEWAGKFDLPATDVNSLEAVQAQKTFNMTAQQFLDNLRSVNLIVTFWDVDAEDGSAYLTAEQRDTGVSWIDSSGEVGSLPRPVQKRAFVSVRGNIDLTVIGGGVYRIEPLPGSPKYHLVYEVDTEKSLTVREWSPAGGYSAELPEQERKRAEYEEFRRNLPTATKRPVIGDFRRVGSKEEWGQSTLLHHED